MSARGRLAWLLAGVLLAVTPVAPGAAPRPHATATDPAAAAPRWSEVFADERDTVVFLCRQALVRAPFSLASAETLWRADPPERLVRVLASPDRRHLAWIARASDSSPGTLWIGDADGVRRRAAFAPLTPVEYGTARFEPGLPTLEDAAATGGRFLASGTLSRTNCSNALAWDWDGSGLWFSYRDGIAHAALDTTPVRVPSAALAFRLRPLDPAPMLYAEVIRLGEGREAAMVEQSPDYGRSGSGLASGIQDPNAPGGAAKRVEAQPGAYLLYPAPRGVRTFRVENFDPSDPWTASEGTVWWLDAGRRVSAVRAGDPRATLEFTDPDPVVWFEYLPVRRTLVRASGARLVERAETGGTDRLVLATASAIRAVLAAPGSGSRFVVTRDSLLVWDPASGSVRGVALEGAAPTRVLAAAGGVMVLVSGDPRRAALRLDRLDPAATRLTPLAAPPIKKAAVALTPSGARLLLYPATERAPDEVEVCDLAAARWSRVAMPGVLGWERPAW